MRRLIVLAALCGAALGIAVPAAAAAPALSVEATREPASVHRNDEYFEYAVKLKNIGDAPTAGTTSLTVAVPTGLQLVGGSGSGWSCHVNAKTCTSTAAVAPAGEFPALKLEVWVIPQIAAASVSVGFDAFGGGTSADALATDSLTFAAAVPFGFTAFTARAEDSLTGDYALAGGHPFSATTSFQVATHLFPDKQSRQVEELRDVFAELPPGFVGNLNAPGARCTVKEVTEHFCPPAAAVGGALLKLNPGPLPGGTSNTPIYNVVPEQGYVAALAFTPHGISNLVFVIRAKLRSSGDYGVTAATLGPQNPSPLEAKYVTLCGFGATVSNVTPGERAEFQGCKQANAPGANEIPFLTNPTRCTGEAQVTRTRIDSWQHQGAGDAEGFPDLVDPSWKSFEASAPALQGCNQLEFAPSFEGRPSSDVADAPAGLDFHLHVPQEGLIDPNGRGSAHLKDTTVLFPQGLVVNPSAANGLAACGSQQIGLETAIGASPVHFSGLPNQCPAASRIGTVEVTTPLLSKPLHGSLYLARQHDNPFGSLLATYLVIEDQETGIVAKLAGRVDADPATGQLSASFEENPQVPFSDLEVHTFQGPRASLRTPATCGPKATSATFTPWSAPESGPPVTLSDEFQTTSAPGGGLCPTDPAQLPNAPRFSAGTVSPTAGAYSPFVLRLSREDGSQELKGIDTSLPPGLTARLAGVAECSDARIAQAQARSAPGEGALEQAFPSCPSSAEVGDVQIAAGAGPTPFHTEGRAYLAGPYKGAPISLAVITPAVAGPFDLGTVVIRNPLYIDPKTTQVSVNSDPIPTILDGIPLDLRSIEVRITRNRFTLNPTSCAPMSIGASAIGALTTASLADRFQVGECSALGFKPALSLRLHGRPNRGAYQRLEASVTYPQGSGYANIAAASVALPHSEFLAQEHIRTVCTRVQFAAHQCPAGSVYGEAEASTPLLDYTLRGPVYLRSSDNPLPDLVAALRGPDSQPIEVELSGRTDSVHGGIRNTFDLVPDAPVSQFTLRLFGGQKSLIVNSRDLCAGKKQRATARFTAQNGLHADSRPVVGNDCRTSKTRKPARRVHHKPSSH